MNMPCSSNLLSLHFPFTQSLLLQAHSSFQGVAQVLSCHNSPKNKIFLCSQDLQALVMKPTFLSFSPQISDHFDYHNTFLCYHVMMSCDCQAHPTSHQPHNCQALSSLTKTLKASVEEVCHTLKLLSSYQTLDTFAYLSFPLHATLLSSCHLYQTLDTFAYSTFPLHNPLPVLIRLQIHLLTHCSHSMTHSQSYQTLNPFTYSLK